MNTDYSYTAVAIFVPSPEREKIADCSRALEGKCKAWYVLDEQNFPPHVTTWIAYVPTRNLEAIANTVQSVLNQAQGFEISIGDVKVEEGGYVALEIETNKKLHALHNLLLQHLNHFREGFLSQKYIDTMHTFSSEQQHSLKTYGTRAAGNLFAPHITVGIVPSESVPIVRKEFVPILQRVRSANFIATDVVFFRQGKPGKSIEVIRRYTLGSK